MRFRLHPALALSLCACSPEVAGTLAEEAKPVVVLQLSEDDSIQLATITFLAHNDSATVDTAQPVLPEVVSLEIRDDSGRTWPLGPVAGRPGFFQTVMLPQRGVRYRLVGSVADREVSFTTLMPGPFSVARPAAETLSLAADTVPCRFAPGATFVCWVMEFVGPVPVQIECRIQNPDIAQDLCQRDGDLSYLQVERSQRVENLRIVLHNSDAGIARFRDAFVFFSGAAVERRWINVPPLDSVAVARGPR